jgi:hypothetical protein
MLKHALIVATMFAGSLSASSSAMAHGHGGHWGGYHGSAFPWELAAPSREIVKVYVRSPSVGSCADYADKYERTGKAFWLRKYETCIVAAR